MKTYIVDYKSTDDFKSIPISKINSARSIMIQIFSGIIDKTFLSKVVKELKDIFPKSKIIGSTTDGEIINEKVTTHHCIISISSFEKTDLKSAYVEDINTKNSFEKGKELSSYLKTPDAKAMICFADGLYTNGEDFIKGTRFENEDVVIAGGLAGDNAKFEKTFVICDDKILTKGAVAIILVNKDLIVKNDYRFGWIPLGKKLKITHAVKNRVYSIENMKAVDAYRHYLGEDTAKRLPKTGIEFPLICLKNGMEIARAVVAKNDDGSLDFAGNINTGEYYQFGLGNIDLILNDLSKLEKKYETNPIESIFIYSCMARRRFLLNGTPLEIAPFTKLAKTAGFFTYGEFFHLSANKNELLNETMTFLTLSESAKVKKNENHKISNDNYNENTEQLTTLKALSHLVAVTNNELEHVNDIIDFEKNIFVQGPVIIFKCKSNEKFDVDYISANVINQFGYSSHDFINKEISFVDIILEKDINRIRRRFRDFMQNDVFTYEEEFSVKTKCSEIKSMSAYFMIDKDPKGNITGFNGYMVDITKRKEIESKFYYLAYHDPLTNLLNRGYFKEKLSPVIKTTLKGNLSLALIFFDLNRFKEINDTLGHDVGDKLLQMVASSIKEVIRGEDLFFRFGGDEFVILLSYIKKENIVKNIKNFAKRVQAIFEKPFIINGHKIYSSTSMGASIFPQDSDKIDDILRFADKAMYISKKENLGEIKFHHELQKERNDYIFGQKKEFQGEYLIKDTV